MKTPLPLLLGGACLLAAFSPGHAQTLAFPGALGFGANASGAATLDANGKHVGGNVYHVTNLNDSGSGSFRDAVASSGRVVVFDVGGYINLASAVSVQKNITIAGQTAPGGGIGFTGAEISFANRSNIILRFVRIRPGSPSPSSDDCLSFYRAQNIIVDHTSLDFAKWNNIDAVGDSVGASTNITVQNSIIANPIGQQFGAHTEMVGGFFSWFNNVFANGHNRQPLAKDNTIFINNVLYNFEAGYTTHTSTPFKHDIVNNYFVGGPASGAGGNAWFQIDTNQSMYYTGNLLDANKDGLLNGVATAPYPGYQGTGKVLTAPWSPITTAYLSSALTAANAVVYTPSVAGCLPHDPLEQLVVSQLKTLGAGTVGYGVGTAGPKGGLYTSQAQTGLPNNGFGLIAGGSTPIDSDQDGMPDDWESAKGLNANNAADGKLTAASGYTNLEDYLNWLALPHAFIGKGVPVDLDLSPYASGFPANAVYTVTNATGGTVTQPVTGGQTVHFAANTSTEAVAAGFNFTVSSGGYTMNGTFGVLVSKNAAAKDLLWQGGAAANVWDASTQNWLDQNTSSSAAYGGGDRVTFDDTGSHSPSVNIAGIISPSSVEVNTDARDYTFTGYGWLSGSTALVKDGAGTLTISPTVLTVSSMMTSGSNLLTVPTTANISVGMPVSANSGIPSSTFVTVVTPPTSVTLSKSATITQTANVNYLAVNTYTGPTTFNAGTIVLNTGGSLGNGALNLYSTLTNGSDNTFVGINNSIVVAAGSVGTINMGSRFGIGGSLSGSGTLNLNAQTTISRDDITGSFSAFAGSLNFVGSGGVRLFYNGGSFGGLDNATVNLGSSVNLQPQTNSGGNTINIGELAGGGNLIGGTAGTATWAIGGLNTSSTFSGQILDNGLVKAALTKNGTGTLTLTGASNFTGATTVNGGALATLGYLGGMVAVNNAATLSPGLPGAPTGEIVANGGLTVAAGGTLAFDLSSSPSGANDRFTVNSGGALTFTGANSAQVNFTDGCLGAGVYPLIGGAGAMGLANVTPTLTTTPAMPTGARQTLTLERAANGAATGFLQLRVVNDIASLIWGAASGSTWDTASTGNWSSNAPANSTQFFNFDRVTFGDATAGGTINLSGTVAPLSIDVNGNTASYTFAGAGGIGGSAKLTKSGAGTLTISDTGANTFTGGTVLNSGKLSLTVAGSVLGTGLLEIRGGVLDLVPPAAPTTSVLFSGSAAITSTGNAYIVSVGTNTLSSTGNPTVDLSGLGGILSVNGDMSGFSGTLSFGAGNRMLRLNGGNTGTPNYNSGSSTAVFDLGSNSASISNRNGGATMSFGSVKSTGANTVLQGRQNNSSGYVNATAVTFSGTGSGAMATATAVNGVIVSVAIANGGTGYTTAPTVAFATGPGVGVGAAGTVTVSGGVVTGVTVTNGGTGARTSSNYLVGALGTDATFAGKIFNEPGLNGGGDFLGLNIIKVGAGNWTLSGTSSYLGDMLVSEGKLTVSGTLNNTGDFEVQEGAALALAGGTINTAAVMIDGSATLTGCGTINGDLVNQGTATVDCTALTINGAIENDGTLRVTNGKLLTSAGVLINNGVLDLITGFANLPSGLTNNGTVLDSSAVSVKQTSKSGNAFSVSVQTYPGHSFTLMRSSALGATANWQAVQTKDGTGAVLQFDDTAATGNQQFYRFQIAP